jgi:small subunit ribosomal protein S16
MAVKIRLSMIGKKKAPVFRIVAIDSRKKRDGACLENLGTYDAIKGVLVQLHADRVDYWISQGAIVTDSVKKIMKLAKKAGQEESAVEVKKVEKKPKKTKTEAKS